MTRLAYVDASAIVKLVVEEPGSLEFLRWFIEAERVATSRVGIVESRRAASRREHDPAHRDHVLAAFHVVELDASIGRRAAALPPPALRTLDAIHLASAQELMPELDAFVTYDDRLATAGRALGLPVVRPA